MLAANRVRFAPAPPLGGPRLLVHDARSRMPPPLHPAWRDHRTRRWTVAIAAASLAAARVAALSGSWAAVAPLATAASGAALIAAVVWFAGFRCPFCANHFHWTWLFSDPFAARCLHCGFERLRDPDAGRAYVPSRPSRD